MSILFGTEATADFEEGPSVRHIEDIYANTRGHGPSGLTQLRDELRTMQEDFARNERINVESMDRQEAVQHRFMVFTNWFPHYCEFQHGRTEALNERLLEQTENVRALNQAITRMEDLHTERIAALERSLRHVEALLDSHIATHEVPVQTSSAGGLRGRSSPAPTPYHPTRTFRRHGRIDRLVRGPTRPSPGRSDPIYPDMPGGRNPAYFEAARRASRRSQSLHRAIQPTSPVTNFPYAGAPHPDIQRRNPSPPAARNGLRRRSSARGNMTAPTQHRTDSTVITYSLFPPRFTRAQNNVRRVQGLRRPETPPTTPVNPVPDAGVVYPDIPGGNFLPYIAAARNVSRRGNSMTPDVPPTTPVTPFPDAGEPYPDIPGGNAVPHVSASVAQSVIYPPASHFNGRMELPLTPPSSPITNGPPATRGAFALAPAAEIFPRGAARNREAGPIDSSPDVPARSQEALSPYAMYAHLPVNNEYQEYVWDELRSLSERRG